MNMNKLMTGAFALTVATSATLPAFADGETPPPPVVSGVTMTQANDRKVTINYTLADGPAVITLDVQTNATPNAAADDPGWTSIGGEAIWNAAGDVWKKVEGDTTHTITWRPDQSWPGHKITGNGARAVVTAWATNNTPQFMVVDLDVPNSCLFYPAKEYLPKSSFKQQGAAITNNVNFKTRQLLMRKIEAAGITWPMGYDPNVEGIDATTHTSPHNVTLADNYYIGVFEVTQAQWTWVTNSIAALTYATKTPKAFNWLGDTLPANYIWWQHVRDQPADTAISGTGCFLGALNARTGLSFDLPSESQWEFAARAGHYSGYLGDGSARTTENLNNFAWTSNNSAVDGSKRTHEVGLLNANDFDLYDTLGNVDELLLDAGSATTDVSELNGSVLNPSTAIPGTRLRKGGNYNVAPLSAGTAVQKNINNDPEAVMGFRLVCPVGIQ